MLLRLNLLGKERKSERQTACIFAIFLIAAADATRDRSFIEMLGGSNMSKKVCLDFR